MVEVMAGAIDENNASCQDICAYACERCDDRIVAKGYLDGIEEYEGLLSRSDGGSGSSPDSALTRSPRWREQLHAEEHNLTRDG